MRAVGLCFWGDGGCEGKGLPHLLSRYSKQETGQELLPAFVTVGGVGQFAAVQSEGGIAAEEAMVRHAHPVLARLASHHEVIVVAACAAKGRLGRVQKAMHPPKKCASKWGRGNGKKARVPPPPERSCVYMDAATLSSRAPLETRGWTPTEALPSLLTPLAGGGPSAIVILYFTFLLDFKPRKQRPFLCAGAPPMPPLGVARSQ